MKPLDLCLVVGMFLTGFDSKKLNTLYVDKNLEYHGLLQAFSRTNRVLNEKKRFGKIVCFRDLKSNVDTAIRLFSNSNNPEEIVRPPFEDVKRNISSWQQTSCRNIQSQVALTCYRAKRTRKTLYWLSVKSSASTQRFRYTKITVMKQTTLA